MELRAGGLTAIKRLRAERVCANNEEALRSQRSGCGQTTVVKGARGWGPKVVRVGGLRPLTHWAVITWHHVKQ